jgi:AsmA protein
MRKLGIAVLVVVVLIILALVVAPSFIDVNQYRGRIETELQQRLGRPVQLGQMHLTLLPPAFRVDNATIGEDPRFGPGPFAQVQQLYVSVKLWPLLHKDVQISALELARPRIELIRNAQGVWNFASLGHPEAAPSPPPPQPAKPQAPQPPPAPAPAQAFSLDHLKISDGTLALTDYQKHQARAVYDHIDLDLANFAPDKAFTVDAAVHLPGPGTQVARLQGKVGPLNSQNFVATPINATLKLSDVQLSGAEKFLNTQALAGTDAVLSGTLGLKNENGSLASEGVLTLNEARVRGTAIGYPIDADYRLTDNLNTDVINISKGDIKLGGTPFSLTGTLDTSSTPAQLDVQLKAANASLSELARLASAFGVAFNPGMQVAGNLNADIRARGASDQPALNGSLVLRNVQISGSNVPQPITVSDVNLALTPQDISSNDFTATAGSTSLAVQFALAAYTTSNPDVTAALRTSNANIAELLNIARAYGLSAAEGVTGSGTLSLDVHASGPVKNASALTFSGNGQVRDARLKPPSLTGPVTIRTANLKFTQNAATVDNLAASLGATNATGMMTVRNFAAPAVQFTLNADKVDITELQQLLVTAKPAPRAAFNWSLVPQANAQVRRPTPSPQPSVLDKMTGAGSVAIGTVIYDQLVLNNLRSNVTLDHGLIRLSPVTAMVYGGEETGNITLDTRQTPTAVVVSTNFQRVDANKLLSSVSSLKDTLYGLLGARGNTTFRATSANDIARTLNGQLSLDLANGRLAHVDLLNELAKVGKFLGSTQQNAQPFTNLLKLTGNFNVVNGLAQTNDLQAVIDGGTLAAQGSANLVDQALNMHLTAVLSKAFSQKVGGTGIGGFMNTALANKNGELVIPVIVTGTFQHPQFAPDVQKLAQMKLQNLLPTTSNPAAGVLGQILGKQGQGGLGGILGALGGQQQQQKGNQPVSNPQQPPPQQQTQQQQQQQQKQNTNPFSQILDSVLKKQQQKKQPPPPPPPPQSLPPK